jgi:hypothetical protein
VQRYDNLPRSTILHVCASSPLPVDWAEVGYHNSLTTCGHPPDDNVINVMSIRKD